MFLDLSLNHTVRNSNATRAEQNSMSQSLSERLHADPTDMRDSTSVFQIRTINWSKLNQ